MSSDDEGDDEGEGFGLTATLQTLASPTAPTRGGSQDGDGSASTGASSGIGGSGSSGISSSGGEGGAGGAPKVDVKSSLLAAAAAVGGTSNAPDSAGGSPVISSPYIPISFHYLLCYLSISYSFSSFNHSHHSLIFLFSTVCFPPSFAFPLLPSFSLFFSLTLTATTTATAAAAAATTATAASKLFTGFGKKMSTLGEHFKKGVEKVASQTQANLAVKPVAGGQGLGGDGGVFGAGLGQGGVEDDSTNPLQPPSALSSSLGTSGETAAVAAATTSGGGGGGGAFMSGWRNAFSNTNIGT